MESEGVVPLDNKTFDPKMINHHIDVYYFPGSPPSRAVLMVIKALGINHKIKMTNLAAGEHLSEDFIKMNPMHTVPTIDDKGFILWDSHVIMQYLVDQYAKNDSLFPKDPRKRALVNQMIFYEATSLFPKLVDYCKPVLFCDQQPDATKAADFEDALSLLDGFLKNRTWIAGENLTIADFGIITIIANAEAVMFNISKYSHLFDWYQRAKNAMTTFGYEEVNQTGAEAFGAMFKSKLN